jgi:hypothetical protein
LLFYGIQDNVFGKARGRKPYSNTATPHNAAQKDYLGFYNYAAGVRAALTAMAEAA